MNAARELIAAGVFIHDHYLDADQLRALRGCAQARHEAGEFEDAGIGGGRALRQDARVRGDRTRWLEEPLRPAERALLGRLEELRLALNREQFLGLLDLEMHYAWYPPGAGYARHVDQPRRRTQRKVSLVLYLNDAWPADAGGELRLFSAQGHVDIAPLGGRLVCFPSARQEHQVLPASRDRLSLTGWFRVRD